MLSPETPTFRKLRFAPPERLAIESGYLFDNTLIHSKDPSLTTAKSALECIERFDHKADSLYAITTSAAELLAAAKVTHNTRDDASYVALFAVPPIYREQGFGRMLMGHIGNQAISNGHDSLKLHTLIAVYFSKLGFHAINAMETGAGTIFTMVAAIDALT
jgi:hypothetical protein